MHIQTYAMSGAVAHTGDDFIRRDGATVDWEAVILEARDSDLVDFIPGGTWFQSHAGGLLGLDDGLVHLASPVRWGSMYDSSGAVTVVE